MDWRLPANVSGLDELDEVGVEAVRVGTLCSCTSARKSVENLARKISLVACAKQSRHWPIMNLTESGEAAIPGRPMPNKPSAKVSKS